MKPVINPSLAKRTKTIHPLHLIVTENCYQDGRHSLEVVDSYDTEKEATKAAFKYDKQFNGRAAIKKQTWYYRRVLVIPSKEISY